MGAPIVRGNTAAGRVLSQLRHGPKTVEELAKELRLTGNAVRNQLRKLQADNLVVQSGRREGISKPSILFAITLEGQIEFSTLYLPVLMQFLRVAEGQCSNIQLASFMAATGKSLAARYPKPTGAVRDRARAAARLLKLFGGVAEVRTRDSELVIRSLACPLAALTAEHPAACSVLEALLADYIGVPVRSCCNRADEPQCCFEVKS